MVKRYFNGLRESKTVPNWAEPWVWSVWYFLQLSSEIWGTTPLFSHIGRSQKNPWLCKMDCSHPFSPRCLHLWDGFMHRQALKSEAPKYSCVGCSAWCTAVTPRATWLGLVWQIAGFSNQPLAWFHGWTLKDFRFWDLKRLSLGSWLLGVARCCQHHFVGARLWGAASTKYWQTFQPVTVRRNLGIRQMLRWEKKCTMYHWEDF